MTKKKLNIDSITNELEGASLFFTKPASPPLPAEPVNQVVEENNNIQSLYPTPEKTENNNFEPQNQSKTSMNSLHLYYKTTLYKPHLSHHLE